MSTHRPTNRLAFASRAALSVCSLAALAIGCGDGETAPSQHEEDLRSAERDREVVESIDEQNQNISTDDRNAKFCKMVASPFVFYRGSNHLFWADLADDSRLASYGNEDTKTWLQGDLHAENYGAFDDDEGQIVFDLNDFDEAVVADYQLDVWRMAVSLVLVDRQNGTAVSEAALDSFAEAYLDAAASYRGNDDELDVKVTKENAYGLLDEFLEEVESDESRTKMLDKWTELQDGVRVFKLSSSKLAAAPEVEPVLSAAWSDYLATLSGGLDADPEYFAVKSVAARLNAGTGSLGTPRYYVLIEGASVSQDDDRILDVKLQGAPSAYPYLSADERGPLDGAFANHAERVVAGQKALGLDVDDHLGWIQLEDGAYSVRERSPFKESFDLADLTTQTRFEKLAAQWGTLLAAAHSRADEDFDDRFVSNSFDKALDEATDGDHAGFRALVREVASTYADQVESDYAAFVEWVHGDLGLTCD